VWFKAGTDLATNLELHKVKHGTRNVVPYAAARASRDVMCSCCSCVVHRSAVAKATAAWTSFSLRPPDVSRYPQAGPGFGGGAGQVQGTRGTAPGTGGTTLGTGGTTQGTGGTTQGTQGVIYRGKHHGFPSPYKQIGEGGRVQEVLHWVLEVPHRVLEVPHRVLGVPHWVLGVLHTRLGLLIGVTLYPPNLISS